MDSAYEPATSSGLCRIISGGQTGAERAGLDWAIEHGVEHGGFCPRGRRAEGGPVPNKYALTETSSRSSLMAAERNVLGSDGTLILTCKRATNSDSRRIMEFARRQGKPHLHLWRAAPMLSTVRAVQAFVRDHGIAVLNVAGSRESKEPAVRGFVHAVLNSALLVPAGESENDRGTEFDQSACPENTRMETANSR